MNRVRKFDDSEADGEYFSLDLNTWEEIVNHRVDSNRIGIGRAYGLKDVKVFVLLGNEENTKRCEEYILFNRKDWIELRKSRGEDKHKNLTITIEGTIWIGDEYDGYKIKTYIKRASE
jgi:hypothetical protein